MPDRTVKVSLLANVAGYVRGMEIAGEKTRAVEAAARKQRESFDVLGRSMVMVGALAAAAVGLAIKEFTEYDEKLGELKAVTQATGAEMDKFSDAALHAGQQFGYTANEVVDAEVALSKAGLTVNDTIAALPDVLTLAAASGLSVADASMAAAQALIEFNLAGADAAKVADLFANADDKSLMSIQDITGALSSAAPIAHSFGISIEDTTGTLVAFSKAGLTGENSGTALRQMLLKLQSPTAAAAATMKDLGLNFYDSSGAFVGLEKVAGQLKDKLGGLTVEQQKQALATIFGARATQGATVLLALGAEGVRDSTAAVSESGAAAKDAAAKLDNLAGDAKRLGAAFNTDLIESGSGANDTLRTLVQTATGLVSLVGSLPQPVMNVGLALTGVVGILGLTGGGALLAIPKIAKFREALETLKISGFSAAKGIGVASLAMAGAVVVLAALAARQQQVTERIDTFKNSLDQTTGALTDYTRQVTIANLQSPFDNLSGKSLADIAKEAGVSLKELTDAVEQGGGALDKVSDKITKYGNTLSEAQGGGLVRNAAQDIRDMNGQLTDSQQQWQDAADAARSGVGSTADAGDAYKAAADQAANLDTQLNDLIDTINKANGVGQDAITTNAAYQKATADTTQAVKDYVAAHGKSTQNLNEATAAGSANAAMLADLAKKNEDAAKAQFDLDGNTNTYVATLTAGHDAVVAQAEAFGASADQAQALADKVAGIPTAKEIKILVNDAALNTVVARLIALQDRHFNAFVDVNTTSHHENGGKYVGGVQAFADGGIPTGKYAGRAGGIRMFAEANVGSEWYISQKPGQEARNRQLALDAYKSLGGQVSGPVHYAPAGGGTTIINRTIQVSVPIERSLVGDEDFLTAKVVAGVKKGLGDGTVSTDWATGG